MRVLLRVRADTRTGDTRKMPKLAVPLTDVKVKNAKKKDKPYKLADGGGLYLLVETDGARYWRMRYRFAGTEPLLAFGKYPQVTLAEARDKRTAARKLLTDGIDPNQHKKDNDRLKSDADANTFEKLAREWHANKLSSWHETTARDTLRRLEIDIFPEVGTMAIASITHKDIIAALRKVEARGAQEVAHRLKATCARIFSYAIQYGITDRNNN